MDEETRYPEHFDGAVSVTLEDGRTQGAREAVNRGSPERPLTDEDLAAKFVRKATLSGVPRALAAEMAAAIGAGGDIAATVTSLNAALLQAGR